MRFALGLLLLLAASSTVAVTFNMRVVYICATTEQCGATDDHILSFVEKANRKFVPTGISFRPTIERMVNANYAAITYAEGESPRVMELLANAQATPDRVTLFLIKSTGDACWARPAQDAQTSQQAYHLFCNTMESGATVAHELGHYFCLNHTFTFDDPASHPAPVSHDGDGLWETWEDPGVFETEEIPNEEADEGPGREWCETVNLPDAYGDVITGYGTMKGSIPHQGCTMECVQSTANGGTFLIPYEPKGENGLSYFESCWGPWTHNGTRREFFVPTQTQSMLSCIANEPVRQLLVDACAGLGGDSDGDGQCDQQDQCPDWFALVGKDHDDDDDGITDDCDLCPGHYGNGIDTDHDSVCDAVDVDDDNDMCIDGHDKHPLEDTVVIGYKVGDRPQCTGPVYGWEGMLIPNVGRLCNWLDSTDVDNDGIPDSEDIPCLLHPGHQCAKPVSCPLPPPNWRLICATGGCNELELVVTEVSNPGTILARSRFQIVNDAIYARASNGMSLFETARTFAGAEPPTQIAIGAPAKAKAATRRLRFEIRRRDGSVVEKVAEVDAADVRLGPLVPADAIVLTTDDRLTQVNVDVSWGNGIAPGANVPDADRDGIYDASDNCTAVANRDQLDGDGDGYGSRCDPDLDNDGRITKADGARMAAAIGGIEQPAFVAELAPGADKFAPGGSVPYDAAADLDGDGRVTADDQRLWSGLRLGPSGIR